MSKPWLKNATEPARDSISAGPSHAAPRAESIGRQRTQTGLHPAAREIFSLWASCITAAAVPGTRRRR